MGEESSQRAKSLGEWSISALFFFALAVLSHWVVFRTDLERQDDAALLLLVLPMLPMMLTGGVLGRRGMTVGMAAFAALTGAACSLVVFYGKLPEEGVASPIFRSLLVFPFLALLAAAVGAALTFLFFSSGRFDARFDWERFVGLRHLRSWRGTVLSVVTFIALLGVVLGVWMVIFALSVFSGFEGDLIDKIIDSSAHIAVSKHAGYVFDTQDIALAEQAAKKFGAAHTTHFIDAEVLIASDTNHTEGHLYGIDPQTAPPVYGIFDKLVEGGLDRLQPEAHGAPHLLPPTEEPENHRIALPASQADDAEAHTVFPLKHPTGAPASPLPGVIIGVEMANQLHVELGDSLTLVSPLIEELTPQGPAAKAKVFRVAGLVKTRMYETDAHYLAISLPVAQRFLELGDAVSGLAIDEAEPRDADLAAKHIVAELGGYPFQAVSWQERNRSLFMSLKLEKAVAFLVLVFMVLVASFSIVNTLTMAVIEKGREIAILKTMGASDVSIAKIFVIQGAVVGVAGTIVGAVVGCAFSLFVARFGFYIDPQVYNVDRLPVRLHAADVISVTTLAMVLTSLSTIFPALAGARLSPVEGLRYE